MQFPDAKAIVQEEVKINPRKLLLVKHPKVGGTHALTMLKGNHIVDFENGTGYHAGPAKVFNVREELSKYNQQSEKTMSFAGYAYKYLQHLKDLADANGPICKYLTLDTATQLEDVANLVAVAKYKKTAMGSNFQEKDITLLPRGAGYGHLRNSFKNLYKMLEGVYSEALIIVAHPKDSSITVEGKEVQVSDINLTGRLKQIVTSDMDAMGTIYRSEDEPNVNMISFKTTKNDLITGARCPHLRNQEFEFSRLEKGNLKVNWDQIFLA